MQSDIYEKNGAYYEKVAQRLKEAANPSEEAAKLVAILRSHTDSEHDDQDKYLLADVTDALNQFEPKPENKNAEIKAFCDVYCRSVVQLISKMQMGERDIVTTKLNPPATFASAIMGVLFDNSDAVDSMMNDNFTDAEKSAIKDDVLDIATKELNVSKASLVSSGLGAFFGIGNGPDPEEIVMDAIINDAKQMGGDKSYQVDIGV